MEEIGISLQSQIRKNRLKTAYLFTIFPLLAITLTYIAVIIYSATNSIGQPIELMDIANDLMSTVGFWVLLGVAGWSIISYYFGSKMIMAFAGAKPITKRENQTLYNVVENSAIAAGLPVTPQIYILNDHSLNAFATGANLKQAKVAISKGLLETLSKSELEAVMAHEIGHIKNGDTRVMLLAITLLGAIEMIGELLIRTRWSGRNSSSSKGNAGAIFFIVGILFITVGSLIGKLAKLAISREREYLADATSAHITSNPLALARALEKIAGDARIESLDKKSTINTLCIADPSAKGHKLHSKALNSKNKQSLKNKSHKVSFWQKAWSTHPPITERISRLERF